MSPFTRTNVCFGVWKQIVGTEGEQVKLANLKPSFESSTYILVIEVIALRNSNKERLIPIFAHKLVEFLLNEIHFQIININYSTVALVFINDDRPTLSGSSQFNCSSLSVLDC
jgi:hypothetical protein